MPIAIATTPDNTEALAVRLLLAQCGIPYQKAELPVGEVSPLLITVDGETFREPEFALVSVATKYSSLRKYIPEAEDIANKICSVIQLFRTSITPAMNKAIQGGPTDALVGLLQDFREEYLQDTGFCVGTVLSAADIFAATVVRPWVLRDLPIPAAFIELSDAVGDAFVGWDTIMGPYDEAILKVVGSDKVATGHLSAWNMAISATHPVQPEDLLKLAESFEVDVVQESCLLWALKQALETPLPPHWRIFGESGAESKEAAHPGGAAPGVPALPTGNQSRRALLKKPSDMRLLAKDGSVKNSRAFQFAAAKAKASQMRLQQIHTGILTQVHPATQYLVGKLEEIRQFATTAGLPLNCLGADGRGSWMRFARLPGSTALPGAKAGAGRGTGAGGKTHEDAADAERKAPTEFFYDFERKVASNTLPQGCRLIPVYPSPGSVEGTIIAASTAKLAQTSDVSRAVTPSVTGQGLQDLHFTSWWNEGSKQPDLSPEVRGATTSSFESHVVDIYFTISTGSFRVSLQGDDKVYTLSHVEGRRGPLECWDLHVGGTIVLLGRKTTMMQASSATQQWLDRHAAKLDKATRELAAELQKYDPPSASRLTKHPAVVQTGGRTNLRTQMDTVLALRQKLSEYRPKVADAIVKKATSLDA